MQPENADFQAQQDHLLAPYACFSSKSKGRIYPEETGAGRSEFQRDRDRIIHSTAFRRLEYKTQVFLYNEGDHYRTRLTHSIEVAQLARSVARILRIDEDLSEAISLAHDLGHAPFGHAGEEELEKCMYDYGGFDHNAQTVRILTKLEKKYSSFKGLNLTWECLEGLAKHNGPVDMPSRALAEFNAVYDLELETYAGLEAQISSLCDDIAYNSHDIEDGIRAELFNIDDISHLPVIHDILSSIPLDLDENINVTINEVRSAFIKYMISDLIEETNRRLEQFNISSADDIRNNDQPIASFSESFENDLQEIRDFLFESMYKHRKVIIMTQKAKMVLRRLFEFYMENPTCLPYNWIEDMDFDDKEEVAVKVADFIAGMTDRYAFRQYNKIFDTNYTTL